MNAAPQPAPGRPGRELQRGSDIVQALLARVLLLCLVLVVPAAALAAGAQQYQAGLRTAQEQAASRHQVTAHLLTAAPVPTSDRNSAFATVPVTVGWTGGDRIAHSATVQALPGEPAGTPLQIWTGPTGAVTSAPVPASQAAHRGWEIAGMTTLAGCGACLLLWQAGRFALDRHRFAQWEAEWAMVEPVWSRHPRAT